MTLTNILLAAIVLVGILIIYKMVVPNEVGVKAAKDSTPLLDKLRDLLSMRQIDEGAFLETINRHYYEKYSLNYCWERLEDVDEHILEEWYNRYKYGGGVSKALVSDMHKHGMKGEVVGKEMPKFVYGDGYGDGGNIGNDVTPAAPINCCRCGSLITSDQQTIARLVHAHGNQALEGVICQQCVGLKFVEYRDNLDSNKLKTERDATNGDT